MKPLTKLALVTVALIAAASVKADWVSGHFRSNGIYVSSDYRTPANAAPYDHLSYRGYPSQQPGYNSPRRFRFDSDLKLPNNGFSLLSQRSCVDEFMNRLETMPKLNNSYRIRTFDSK